MITLALDGTNLELDDVLAVARAAPGDVQLRLAPAGLEAMRRSRAAVERLVAEGAIAYGVTTGFGSLRDHFIPPEHRLALQRNIVVSHAVGVGPPLERPVVRAMMLIRANTLAKGLSGIRPELVELLLRCIERGVHPVVPTQGSLGASGDLAPLAHMALVLIGRGEAEVGGETIPGHEALRRAGLNPIELQAKEGLALTNGTALMAGLGCLLVQEAENSAAVANIAGCLSLEALHGTVTAYDERIQAARPHPRQRECAATLRALLAGSTFVRDPRPVAGQPPDPQDAYSLRCIPQVHGACMDAIAYARWVLQIELNSATDNPLIFIDAATGVPEVVSGGNFHGEPLAIAFDYLALALTELGNIAERRLARLLDPACNGGQLPPFLTEHAGLHSGLMLVQYTAAALASENKALTHPASADTIPTSANWEDHVSNGPIAARKARQIARNLEQILAIELLAGCQAIDFRRREQGPRGRLGAGTGPVYELIRGQVPFMDYDQEPAPLIAAVHRLVSSGQVRDAARVGWVA